MWRLNVGLLWSSLVWCCSNSCGVSQQTPMAPSEPQPGREAACPGPACWGTFQPLFQGPYFPSPAGPCCLPTLSRALPASTSNGAKQRVQSPRGSGKVHGTSPRRLGCTHPRAAFLVDISAVCSSKLAFIHLRMTWSHLISDRVATSALALGSDGKGSCFVLHPPAAPQEHLSFYRWKTKDFALFLFLKAKGLSANILDLIAWLNFEFMWSQKVMSYAHP